MLSLKYIFLPVILLLLFINLKAQPPKTGKNKTPTTQNKKTTVPQKFKLPKVKTSWENYADSATITVDEAVHLLSLPIKITDYENIVYPVSSYQFLYRRKGVASDEDGSNTRPVSNIVAQFFQQTPLTDIWIKSISKQLRAGEELYYFDVVAKDAQGHLFFAPTLKIKIK